MGTWVTDEVKVAVREGYSVVEMHELWQYETTKYDPNTGEGGLFLEYLNCFLKMKQEATGYPTWCSMAEDQSRHNSFWGRFGMRENHRIPAA